MPEPQKQNPPRDEPSRPPEEDADWYEEYTDLLTQEIRSTCRCGECCRRLLIEVGLEDAEREPQIRQKASPIYAPAELTASGAAELEGYLLNGRDLACVFLDQTTNLCGIYETRPLCCRLFDCDGEGRTQLIELGILERTKEEGTGRT